MATARCGRCGAPIDPMRANYDKAGNQVCASCDAVATIAEGEHRAFSGMATGAILILVMGICAVTVFNPFGVMSFASFLSGLSWLLMIARGSVNRRMMGSKLMAYVAMALIGTGLGAIGVAAVVLGLIGVSLR